MVHSCSDYPIAYPRKWSKNERKSFCAGLVLSHQEMGAKSRSRCSFVVPPSVHACLLEVWHQTREGGRAPLCELLTIEKNASYLHLCSVLFSPVTFRVFHVSLPHLGHGTVVIVLYKEIGFICSYLCRAPKSFGRGVVLLNAVVPRTGYTHLRDKERRNCYQMANYERERHANDCAHVQKQIDKHWLDV